MGEGESDRQRDDLGLILVRFKRWGNRENMYLQFCDFSPLHYYFTRKEHLFLSYHGTKFARVKRDIHRAFTDIKYLQNRA